MQPRESDQGLELEIGEGFEDDDLRVLVDGREVWHGAGLTTNYSVGLADVVAVPVEKTGPVSVEVLSRGGGSASYQVDLTAGTGIRLRCQLDPTSKRLELGPAPTEPLF
ncbi:hypothetical protein ACLMAJ_34805 [Nocardia sp. KC 131]|uniref:hypothetical protein n=1 Tax=Nocardia arseniciresistens TaxID=3392119 RepID=UPI00398EADDA